MDKLGLCDHLCDILVCCAEKQPSQCVYASHIFLCFTDTWFIFTSSIWAYSFKGSAVNADPLSVKIAVGINDCFINHFIMTIATNFAEGEVIVSANKYLEKTSIGVTT